MAGLAAFDEVSFHLRALVNPQPAEHSKRFLNRPG